MLKKPWFAIATNFALAALGVQTTSLNSKWRQDNVSMGFDQGLTPKETAVVIYKLLPITQGTTDLIDRVHAEKTISAWRASQSVRNEVSLLADLQAYPKSIHSPAKTPR